jgi:drug/metabolite transporter (DMT)-like permease
MSRPSSIDRVALASFLAGAFLAGGNGVGIRFSNRELAPLWGASLRFSLAAALLLVLMAGMKLRLPRGRALTGALLFGALNFGAGFALAYTALVDLHAGFGQILLALVPLFTLLLAVAQRQEHLKVSSVAGTLLALLGIAQMARAPVGSPLPLRGVLAALGSALCLAEAAVLVRRFPKVHPVAMNATAMAAGAALLLLASLVLGEPHPLPGLPETWVAIGYLAVVGSVVVFILYLVVLHRWPASRAAYSFVLIPFVTLLLSAWVDGERVGAELLVGGALVLAGVYLGALRRGGARED